MLYEPARGHPTFSVGVVDELWWRHANADVDDFELSHLLPCRSRSSRTTSGRSAVPAPNSSSPVVEAEHVSAHHAADESALRPRPGDPSGRDEGIVVLDRTGGGGPRGGADERNAVAGVG